MRPFAPAPPPGAQPPPLWGHADHVRDLFGSRVTEVVAERRTVRVEVFPTGQAFLDFFKRTYGPTIVAYRNVAGDPSALDAALLELARRHDVGAGVMEWEYLLYTGRKR